MRRCRPFRSLRPTRPRPKRGTRGCSPSPRTSDDTAEAPDVHFAFGGSASNGLDYAQILNTVTIPAGQTTVTLKITPIDDTAVESTEAVTLTLLADPTYLLGTSNTAATVNIADNDVNAGFSAHINFQPAASPTFAGYLVDSGQIFGERGNGLNYGWSGDNTTQLRDRNAASSPDQRYDTLVQFNGKNWELASPTASTWSTSSPAIRATSTAPTALTPRASLSLGRPQHRQPLDSQGSLRVSVTDGRLTLTGAAGSFNNKIDFIDVTPYAAGAAYLSVSAPATNASENGPTPRSFTITPRAAI